MFLPSILSEELKGWCLTPSMVYFFLQNKRLRTEETQACLKEAMTVILYPEFQRKRAPSNSIPVIAFMTNRQRERRRNDLIRREGPAWKRNYKHTINLWLHQSMSGGPTIQIRICSMELMSMLRLTRNERIRQLWMRRLTRTTASVWSKKLKIQARKANQTLKVGKLRTRLPLRSS